MKFQYYTIEERESIIATKASIGLLLLEEQNIIDGDFLIFGTSNDAPQPPKPTEMELLAEQGAIIQELIFEIIPTLGGM